MLRTKKIVHRLYGIESLNRHLDERCEPITHGTVPQTGQFKRLQILSVKRFRGDESGSGIYMFGKIEMIALKVGDIADQINRIEMCGF